MCIESNSHTFSRNRSLALALALVLKFTVQQYSTAVQLLPRLAISCSVLLYTGLVLRFTGSLSTGNYLKPSYTSPCLLPATGTVLNHIFISSCEDKYPFTLTAEQIRVPGGGTRVLYRTGLG